jgi:Ubiquitin family
LKPKHNQSHPPTKIIKVMDYSKKSFTELKQLLRDRSQSTIGKKIDLVQRLQENDIKREEEAKRFKVYIKTLVGSYYTIYPERDSTILELKQKIEEKNGTPVKQQVLFFLCRDKPQLGDTIYPDGTIGKKTNDEDTFLSLGVQKESYFYLNLRLRND